MENHIDDYIEMIQNNLNNLFQAALEEMGKSGVTSEQATEAMNSVKMTQGGLNLLKNFKAAGVVIPTPIGAYQQKTQEMRGVPAPMN